ncbi:hypothetical protein ABD87_23020 [Lysinibacillus sphaericus]|nr:hypothetical protein [Lysinibacillus sphaericus]
MNLINKLNMFIQRKTKDRWLYLIGLLVCISFLILCVFPSCLKLISLSIGDNNELLQSTLIKYQESFILLPTFFISIYFVLIWIEKIVKTTNKIDLLLSSIICTSLIIVTLNILFISI